MGFLIHCDIDDKETGQKCRKQMEPVIDKNTGELYCECGLKLNKQDVLTDFAKRQMVSLGQVLKQNKPKQAYSIKCNTCNQAQQPVINKSNKIVCSKCKNEFKDLSAPYANMLKQQLRKISAG